MLKSEFVELIKQFKNYNKAGQIGEAEQVLMCLAEDLAFIECLISLIPDSELNSFSSAEPLW